MVKYTEYNNYLDTKLNISVMSHKLISDALKKSIANSIVEIYDYYGCVESADVVVNFIKDTHASVRGSVKEMETFDMGYVSVIGDNKFLISIVVPSTDNYFKFTIRNLFSVICHEMVHIKQVLNGELIEWQVGADIFGTWKKSKRVYKYDYSSIKSYYYPWEKEARREQEKLINILWNKNII